jgi:hypothetical protein
VKHRASQRIVAACSILAAIFAIAVLSGFVWAPLWSREAYALVLAWLSGANAVFWLWHRLDAQLADELRRLEGEDK